jgi:hypothetical protein
MEPVPASLAFSPEIEFALRHVETESYLSFLVMTGILPMEMDVHPNAKLKVTLNAAMELPQVPLFANILDNNLKLHFRASPNQTKPIE